MGDLDWKSLSPQERYRTSIGVTLEEENDRKHNVIRPFRLRLMVSDGIVLILAMAVGLFVSSRASSWAIDPLLAVYGVPVVIAFTWWGLLALRGSYDQRIIGVGTEEIRRVVSASLYTFALVAGVSYLLRADISRAYAFVSLPLGLVLIVVSRFLWRAWLYHQREAGHLVYRTVVVGSGLAATELSERLRQEIQAGYMVVDHYPSPTQTEDFAEEGSSKWLEGLGALLHEVNADAVAVAPSQSLSRDAVRQLAWYLEERPIEFLLAPAMMETGGTRLVVRPTAGLPLLHLDEVTLSRPQRFAKRALDLSGSTIAIVVLSPVFLMAALWIRFTSRGPVIFRQIRIGQGGKPFTVFKFRTMVHNADSERETLRSIHGHEQPLFKLKSDPRVTKAGKFLRRWSIDELPQLMNVVGGSMSLVGPRPHPLDDVSRYEANAFRRLALKPGMTGLWQVSGRSDLMWEDALQLDLFYVESWSLAGDIVLLGRTFGAVLRARGAS